MVRTFNLRLRPTRAQKVAFEEILRDSCETYNAALQERIEAWRLSRKKISYYDQQRELVELRRDPQFAAMSSDIQREPLRRLDRAFQNFFRRCKSGRKGGLPRFKPLSRYRSFAWHEPRLHGSTVLVPKLGHVKFRSHRSLFGTPKQFTIKRTGNKWVGHLDCDIGPAPQKAVVSNAIGIDLGLTAFATLSDGTEIHNPGFVRKHSQSIARAQRELARKRRGSRNRARAKEQVRRAFRRVANSRRNFCHHLSKSLVTRYDLIAHENLDVLSMARGRLAGPIMGAAWGILIRQLAYKAEEAGCYVIAVNPRGTSQRCSGCGATVYKKPTERRHICGCGVTLGRDENAARNILSLGQRLVAVQIQLQKG